MALPLGHPCYLSLRKTRAYSNSLSSCLFLQIKPKFSKVSLFSSIIYYQIKIINISKHQSSQAINIIKAVIISHIFFTIHTILKPSSSIFLKVYCIRVGCIYGHMLVLVSFKVSPYLFPLEVLNLIIREIRSKYFPGQFVLYCLKVPGIKKVIVGDNCFWVNAKQALFNSQLTIFIIFVVNRGDKILAAFKKFILTKIKLSFLLFFNFSQFEKRRASCFGNFHYLFVLESGTVGQMEKAVGRNKLSTFGMLGILFLFHFNTKPGLYFRQRQLVRPLVFGLGKKP